METNFFIGIMKKMTKDIKPKEYALLAIDDIWIYLRIDAGERDD